MFDFTKSNDKPNGFLNPQRTIATLDVYWSKSRILNALKSQLPHFHGTLLDVGCGRMPYKPLMLAPPSRVQKYIGMDLAANLRAPSDSKFGPPDLEWDARTIPLASGSVDCAIATEIFQYCQNLEELMRE